MIKFLRLLFGVVALILIIAFAIANRGLVDVGLAPLPDRIELPVYGVFLLGLIVGVLVGGIGIELATLPRRLEARRARKRAFALESQLSAIKRRQEREEARRPAAPRAVTVQGGA